MLASGNTYCPYKWRLRSGLDQNSSYVAMYRNGQFQKNVLGPTGADYNGVVDVPWGSQSMSILPLRIGHLSDQSYSDEKVARVFEGVENGRITLQFTFTPKVFVPPLSDGGYTSNWNLTGLQQGFNCSTVQGHPSWGRLSLSLTVAGGNVTVTLSMGGTVQASGTAAIGGGPFVVTLVAQNGSNLNGTVTVSNTVATVAAGTVDIRWPVSMQVLRDTFDPPTTVRDTVAFKGLNTVRWTEASDLGSGTYFYRTQPISDTGITGTQTASVSISTIIRPGAPSSLAYSSGNAAGTILSFLASATPGATYRLYGPYNPATAHFEVGRQFNLSDIAATAIAGSTTITCPPLTGYGGTIYVAVRAVNGGVEERNCNIIALEYDNSGNFVLARPNLPGIPLDSIAISAGRTVTFKGLYNTDHQAATPTSLLLFVRASGAAYTTDANGNLNGNVGAGGALSASGVKGILSGAISYTFPSDGYYYATMLAVTAGGVQSPSVGYAEVLIIVSNDTLPAATGLTAQLSRS